jgi:hypothetical protein
MRTLAAATALLAASAAEAFVPITRAYSGSVRRMAPMMARKPFIAGNWKLNPATLDEATSLAKAVRAQVEGCALHASCILLRPRRRRGAQGQSIGGHANSTNTYTHTQT